MTITGEYVLTKAELREEAGRWIESLRPPHVLNYFQFVQYTSDRGLYYRAPDASAAFGEAMYARLPNRVEVPTQVDNNRGGQRGFEEALKQYGARGLAYRVVAGQKVRYYFSDPTEAVFMRVAL